MPIYAYRCSACGHQKDALQKLSDAPLSTCPACGAETFTKQVTAAGFQLKGSGWYATDFRNSGSNKPASDTASTDAAAEGNSAKGSEGKDSAKGGDGKEGGAVPPTPASATAPGKDSAASSPAVGAAPASGAGAGH